MKKKKFEIVLINDQADFSAELACSVSDSCWIDMSYCSRIDDCGLDYAPGS